MTPHAIDRWPRGRGGVFTFVRQNSLTLAAVALFGASIAGQALTGLAVANDEARDHGRAAMGLFSYLRSGDFVEAVFENWESEFLQMAVFVVLTKFLRQKGSSESKPLGEHDAVDDAPRDSKPGAPWPVRRGGLALALYERSLSLSLVLLFAVSFVLHAVGGAEKHNVEQLRHGGETLSTIGYLATSQFWFESFQNWQSEFLSVGVLVVLSIVLRERGSPQSKPVDAPHEATGGG